MAYFPFFQDLQDQKGLMIGAGKVALHKARIILEYGARLCVVAPEIDPEFRKMKGVILRQRTFIPEDLCEVNFVICATDDGEINRQVAGMCRERGVLVNSVDDRENCSFFPGPDSPGNVDHRNLYGRSQSLGCIRLKKEY